MLFPAFFSFTFILQNSHCTLFIFVCFLCAILYCIKQCKPSLHLHMLTCKIVLTFKYPKYNTGVQLKSTKTPISMSVGNLLSMSIIFFSQISSHRKSDDLEKQRKVQYQKRYTRHSKVR